MAKCVFFCVFLCVQLAFCQLEETCQTVDNEIGSCISIRSCEQYLRLAQDSGSNRDDVFKLLKRAKCGFEGNDMKVCCPRPGFPSKPAITSTTTTPQPETPPPREVADPAYPVRGKTGRALDETCQTVDNEIGSCISISSCEPYLRLAKDAKSNPDPDTVQLLQRAHCGYEGKAPKVCCPRPGFPSKPAITSTTTTPQPETPPPREVADPAYPVRGKTGRALGSVVGGQPAPLDETCQTVDNEIGSCISISSCEPYLRLAKDAKSNPDPDTVQLLQRAHCGYEGKAPKVCCPRPGFPSKPATTSTTTTPQPETPPPREVTYPVRGKTDKALGSAVGGQPAPLDETCQTVDNEIGSCISISSCEPYLRLAKDASNPDPWKFNPDPDTVQLLQRAHCGYEGKTPKVCCSRPGFPSKPATTSTTTQPETAPPTEVAKPRYLDSFPAYPVCGKTDKALGRVVGGEPAPLGAFPWMALLGYKIRGGRGALWNCGGSLVSSRHVLTAAHCIHLYENSLFLVRLGELDLSTESDGATPVDVLIENMIEHEEYNHEMHTNDIGLLWLDKDVQFTSLIRPICLPEANNLRSMTFDKHLPMVAGWGATEFKGPQATHLQAVQLLVFSNSQCANAYSNYTNTIKIDQSILCAGYPHGNKDACQGDSGGPLMQPVYNGTTKYSPYYQIGVVSSGRDCAKTGFPGVYARVTYYMPWLQEKILGNAAQ